MGQAWLRVCQRVAAGRLSGASAVLDNEQLKDLFSEEFRRGLGGVRQKV